MAIEESASGKVKADLICVECRVSPPKTETHYTLISSRHGWRLSRVANPDGGTRMEWRCPTCWAQRKGR
jgi:hypothetical protein